MNRILFLSQQAHGCGSHPQARAENYGPQMAQISQTEMQDIDFSPVTTIFHLISRVFRAFLSHRGLVSRRLCKKQGLFKSTAGIAMHELTQRRKGAETQSRSAGLFLLKDERCAKTGCLWRDAPGDPRDAGATHEMAAAGVYWFAEAAVAGGKGGAEGRTRRLGHDKTQ
jgi:hypothetical protein